MKYTIQDELVVVDVTGKTRPVTKRDHYMITAELWKLREIREELNRKFYCNPKHRPKIRHPSDAFMILENFLAPLDHEEFWVINVDTHNGVSRLVKLYQGTIDSTTLRTAEVFREAIIENAHGIFLAHNHPSGDATPSSEDIGTTRHLIQAGQLLEIPVLDHFIFGRNDRISMKEKGFLP